MSPIGQPALGEGALGEQTTDLPGQPAAVTPSSVPLFLDAHAHTGLSAVTTGTATLTTPKANDFIVVLALTQGGPVTSVSGSTLGSFTRRAQNISGATSSEIWYKQATLALSSEVITVNITSSSTLSIDVLAVAGVNGTPFDPNGALPNMTASGNVTATTSNPTDFLIGWYRNQSSGFIAYPLGNTIWTPIISVDNSSLEYAITTSTVSGLIAPQPPVGGTFGICDALQGGNAGIGAGSPHRRTLSPLGARGSSRQALAS